MDTLSTHLAAMISELDRRYQERFDFQEKATQIAMNASEKAAELAERNTQRWREGSNEWRAAMDDREKRFLPRDEYMAAHKSLEQLVDSLKERADKMEGKNAGLGMGASILVTAVGVTGSLLAIFFALS